MGNADSAGCLVWMCVLTGKTSRCTGSFIDLSGKRTFDTLLLPSPSTAPGGSPCLLAATSMSNIMGATMGLNDLSPMLLPSTPTSILVVALALGQTSSLSLLLSSTETIMGSHSTSSISGIMSSSAMKLSGGTSKLNPPPPKLMPSEYGLVPSSPDSLPELGSSSSSS